MWLGSEQAMTDRTKLMAKRRLGTYCHFMRSEVRDKPWKEKIPDGDKGKIENAVQSTLDWLSGLDENNLVEEAEILAWENWFVGIVNPIMHWATEWAQELPAARSQQRTGSITHRWLRALTNAPLCRRLRLRAGEIRALALPGLASGSFVCSRSPLGWGRPQSSVRRSSRSRRSF